MPDGRSYLDRTTLTPMEDGKVRNAVQIIAISSDGGETWRTGFDAVYVPRKPVSDGTSLHPHTRAIHIRDAGPASGNGQSKI